MGLGPPLLNFVKISLSNPIGIGSIVKVNCLMREMLQNFSSILSILFVIWQFIWQDFMIVWKNIPCTVCHPAMACLVLIALVLLNSVARWCNTIQLFQK